MKTYIELTRGGKTYTWEGDLPLIHEGQLIYMPRVGSTRCAVHSIILEDEPRQRAICAP